MTTKKHHKQLKYYKIPEDLWKEIVDVLWDTENHLDYDFDWISTDEFEKRLEKLKEKIGRIY